MKYVLRTGDVYVEDPICYTDDCKSCVIKVTLKVLKEVPMDPTSQPQFFAYITTFVYNFSTVIFCFCHTRDFVSLGKMEIDAAFSS